MSQPAPSSTPPPAAPNRAKNWITPVTLLFGLYAIFRTVFSIYSLARDAIFGHDLYVQYEPWLLLIHRNTAAEALQTLTYLPHTWILLTPLYALGWHAAEAIWFVINFLLHIYIWHTLSVLTGLRRDQRLLFLALYFSFVSVGVSIALGNPVTACMAATVAAYASANAGRSGIFFALASIKHSIIYPVYLKLVLQRSVTKILPSILFIGLSLLAVMWWAHIGPMDLLSGLRAGTAQVNFWMHENQSICLVPLLQKLLPASLVQIVTWTLWLALFAISLAFIKDRIAQLAALLLIGLLPMHHRSYDLIVATPLIALLIRQNNLLDPCLVTLTLCGLWDTLCNHFQHHHPFVAACNEVYYPLLILILFLITFLVGRRPQPTQAGPL